MRHRLTATLTALLFLSRHSYAEPTDAQRTLAESLFQDAKALVKEGKYAQACPKFEESFRLDGTGGTIMNLADCMEHLGKWATALTDFQKARAMALQANRTDRVQIADAHIAALKSKVARLVVNVASPANGTTVALDGVDLGSAAWGSAMMVDPGSHVVDAKAPGKQAFHVEVQIADAPETKTIDVPSLTDVPSSNATPTASVSTSTVDGSRRTAGLIVAGIGVASFGVGAFFLARGNSLKNDYEPRAPDAADKASSQHTAITVAEIGLGVGVVAMATGAWMVFTSKTDEPPRSGSVHVTPMIATNGGGLSFGGAW